MDNNQKKFIALIIGICIIVSSLFGFIAARLTYQFLGSQANSSAQFAVNPAKSRVVSQEDAVVGAVKKVSPAVVSVIASKDLPTIEQYYRNYNPFRDFLNDPFGFFNFQVPQNFQPQDQQKGTQKTEVGGGTGFIVSSDGLILTNKHVVDIEGADYTVLTNDGKKYPAKILAKDPVQDIAIIKIAENGLPVVSLGDSDKIQIGQTVIAIGNALGEFRNTVSVGVISGLSRSISAAGPSGSESLEGLIQTDAAINEGNSGGPLLNLNGEVVGINVAMASGAQNIGFSLPVNLAKKDIEQVKKSGKISYPFLGVRYVMINQDLKEQKNLPVDYGALIIRGENAGESAITFGSPADKAGLKENDIILEVNGQKIDSDHSLSKIIQAHNVGDEITLKILRDGNEKIIKATLGER